MNLYQHLFIIIPSLFLAFWGFYIKETNTSVLVAMFGLVVLVIYSVVQFITVIRIVFKYLGTL